MGLEGRGGGGSCVPEPRRRAPRVAIVWILWKEIIDIASPPTVGKRAFGSQLSGVSCPQVLLLPPWRPLHCRRRQCFTSSLSQGRKELEGVHHHKKWCAKCNTGPRGLRIIKCYPSVVQCVSMLFVRGVGGAGGEGRSDESVTHLCWGLCPRLTMWHQRPPAGQQLRSWTCQTLPQLTQKTGRRAGGRRTGRP